MFAELYPYKQQIDGIYLYIKVTPKASQNKIGKVIIDKDGNNILKIYVTSEPEHGKANNAIIELLAAKLGITKSLITIIKGYTHKNKTCLIKNIDKTTVLALNSIIC
jgi:uncharacterized protein (TIGR00251 family)